MSAPSSTTSAICPRCPASRDARASASSGRGSSSATATSSPTPNAGFRVVGHHLADARRRPREVAAAPGRARGSSDSVEALLDDPEVEVVDVAVPAAEQPGVIRRILDHPRRVRGHPRAEAAGDVVRPRRAALVEACEAAGVVLQVNQNMRYDQSVRALKTLLDRGALGDAGAGDDRDAGHPALDALGRGRPVALDVHHEHPPPRHLPLLARRPGPRPRQHPARPADEVPARRRHQPLHPRIRRRRPGLGLGRRLGRPGARGGGGRHRHPLAGRGDRGAGPRHDRLARLARARAQHASTTRPIDDRRRLAPPPLARGLVPRRLRRHHGRPAPRPRGRHRARHLRPRQPQDDRPLRGRPRGGPRASRRHAGGVDCGPISRPVHDSDAIRPSRTTSP